MSFMPGKRIITGDKVLSLDEQAYVVRLCQRNMDAEPGGARYRNPLMILLTLECGLRASETLDLRARDFNAKAGTLFIRSKKGCNPRELPLRRGMVRRMKKWILCRTNALGGVLRPEDRIFPINYVTFFRAWDRYRPVPNKGLHSMRHAFAVNLYGRSKNLRLVQFALGHRSILSTMVYLDFHYSQKVLREAMFGSVRPTLEKQEAPVGGLFEYA